MLARVLLAQDRADQALALLNRLHAAAAAQDRTDGLIEIGGLRALAAGYCFARAGVRTVAAARGHEALFGTTQVLPPRNGLAG